MSAWRGPLAIENSQTGDGRIITPGAIEWDDGQLPLAYRIAGDQHVDTITDAPQVGTIDRVWRDGDVVMGEGVIDDDNEDGAELVRRLRDGTASHGTRQGVSIDPDNWQIEVWATETEDEDDELLLTASGSGRMLASAGDPDDTDGRVMVMEDASDQVISRMTRLRLRGATAVAVPAFSGAYVELVGAESIVDEDEPTELEEPADDESEVVRADATLTELPDLVPADWFHLPEPDLDSTGQADVYGKPAEELLVEQGDGAVAVPLTITKDRLVYGHAARWGQCHIGYPDACVTAPTSPSGYAHFHLGTVETDDGPVATGPVTMGTNHAAAAMRAPDAVDHYAHTGMAWADVRMSDGLFGIWMSGRVRPDVTPEQIGVLAGGGVSGDWRTIPHRTGPLEMISLLAVNTPGFGITREPATVRTASAWVEDGVQTSLTSAGVVYRCPNCGQQHDDVSALAELLAELVASSRRTETRTKQIELRTRHLIGPAAEHAMRRISRGDRDSL